MGLVFRDQGRDEKKRHVDRGRGVHDMLEGRLGGMVENLLNHHAMEFELAS